MEKKIVELASTQGIWAALSVALIFYILKTQEKRDFRQEEREQNYQGIISKLTDKLNIVEDVKKDVEEIKSYVFKKNNK
ncbi:BhlA/UviB family holin-like peptide [Tepidibacter mesophilus]|uniref:BhlA/UviB family holin-like peptide n=1 Tax=Tepidibacter mesophilus TaxID=655607 RepID=UPI000C069B35|nr:BhlA/UviB family holin-like peptide [Tepidibacter mesophilus]